MSSASGEQNKAIYKVFLFITLASLLAAAAFIAMNRIADAGYFLMAMFASFAIYARGERHSQGILLHDMDIFRGRDFHVLSPVFRTVGSVQDDQAHRAAHDDHHVRYGNHDERPATSPRCSSCPRGVLVGMILQFTVMPLVGFTIAKSFGFPG